MRITHWNCAGRRFALDEAPFVMGILNVTPDSFSDGGRHEGLEAATAHAEALAPWSDLIDVGGESTRPGFDEAAVTLETERARVMPVVRALVARGFAVSVDTSRPEIMREAAEAGAAVLNDVRGFERPGALEAAAASTCGLVLMHHAQLDPSVDPVGPVYDYLERRTRELEAAGVDSSRICWDPGVGFGKTYEQNVRLIAATDAFVRSGRPLMTAISRKSVVGISTGVERPDERVAGSLAAAVLAARDGAHVLRVHDARETREAMRMLAAWRRAR